ncbi:hypothetical protein ABC195_04360 [Microbacterium sp. 2P01SA-2]|uniref:hypothetical protein n=1 Tax=unclassified Microbacterium TaxID=2609290 RepID=UPI00399F31A4
MDEGVAAELRALRARAYAAGGDIADDPVALARLSELEERERQRRSARDQPRTSLIAEQTPEQISEQTSEQTPEPSPEPGPGTEPSSGDGDDASASAPGSTSPPESPPRPLRSMLMWAGSLVAVAALAVGITAFATARSASTATSLPPDAGITHVTTLLPTGAELPTFFGGYGENLEGRSFEPFLGLAVFETAIFWAPDDDSADSCLFVTHVADIESSTNDSWSGFMNQGCSAGAFPAAISFVVRADQPEELLERYPIGTALQLVLTDAGVDVFVSEAPTSTAAPDARGTGEDQPAG